MGLAVGRSPGSCCGRTGHISGTSGGRRRVIDVGHRGTVVNHDKGGGLGYGKGVTTRGEGAPLGGGRRRGWGPLLRRAPPSLNFGPEPVWYTKTLEVLPSSD
jgi:hypothetical protein